MKASFNRGYGGHGFSIRLEVDTVSESHTLNRLQKRFGGSLSGFVLTATYSKTAQRLMKWFEDSGGKGDWLPGKYEPWEGHLDSPYPPA